MNEPQRQDFPSISEAVERFRTAGLVHAKRRVCWVADEMVELFRNGGAGTVVSGFCDALLSDGHHVSVLYTSHLEPTSPETARALADLRKRGLEITLLQDVASPSPNTTVRTYAVHEWLKSQIFDIVHFHDFNGSGFAACNAKRMGLAYKNTLLCITNFGSSRWAWECMEFYLQTPQDLAQDWLERKSIENADAVLCHSRHMARWLDSHPYELPAATYVQPSIVPFIPSHDGPCGRISTPIREVVFFGRQEVRKGMRVFVDAILKLAQTHPELRFTFLGKFSEIDFEHSGAYVLSRLEAIPNDITFLADFSRENALRYLKHPDVLAVMPSVDDNFPGTVIEAVREGIEFIASSRGGIPEIVHPDDQAARLFALTPDGLAEAIKRVILERPPRPRLAFDPLVNIRTWLDWHAMVPVEGSVETPSFDPLVSVCVLHYNRPRFLRMVMDALRRQTYKNFEVVLVDDGSTDPTALAYLDELRSEQHPFSLKIVTTPDIRLGAARNAGAEASTGEYVLFVDDDNIPRPEMIRTLLRGAQRCNLDVATCLAYIVSGDQEPDEDGPLFVGYHPAGGPIAQGLIDNVFGDANALVRREVFNALGGFDPTPGIGAEDWDFFARVVLYGYRLAVVPEPLYWYRQHGLQLTARPHSTFRYQERLLQTYMKAMMESPSHDFEDLLRVFMGRYTSEKFRTSAWYRLGARAHGEYERQLMPHTYNVDESYRLLAVLCTKMGRFRDSARLVANGRSPHAHLLSMGDEIGAMYATSDRFPQGYYLGASVEKSISVFPAVLSKVRGASPSDRPGWGSAVEYSADGPVIRVHPQVGATSIAVIENFAPPRLIKMSAHIKVSHPDGPTVRFTMLLVTEDAARSTRGYQLPDVAIGKAEKELAPSDGTDVLEIRMSESSSEPLSLILATDVADRDDFAWAVFSDFAISVQ